MPSFLKSRAFLAVVVLLIGAGVLAVVKWTRKPPTTVAAADKPAAETTERGAEKATEKAPATAAPAAPPAAASPPADVKAAPPGEASKASSPAAKPPVAFEDTRPVRTETAPAAATPAASAPSPAATPAAAAKATPPTAPAASSSTGSGPFVDARALSQGGTAGTASAIAAPQPVKAASKVAEPAQPAAQPAAPAAAPAATTRVPPSPSFDDPRGPITTTPNGATASASADAAHTASAPSFADDRSLLDRPGSRTAPMPAAPKSNADTTRFATAQPSTAAAPAPSAAARAGCAPAQLMSEPLEGGRMLVRVVSPCRAEQGVRFGYAATTLVRALDTAGRLELTFDLYAGTTSPVVVSFLDGTSRELSPRARDLDQVEKVALVWRAPVDLDLHVFEYGAAFGGQGHVWSGAPSSAGAARDLAEQSRRGHGFLGRDDDGRGSGDHVEVYTLFRQPDQRAGAVSIAVDYASRGEVASGSRCGTSADAQVAFELITFSQGRVEREQGVLASVPCNTPIGADARFAIQHQIRLNR